MSTIKGGSEMPRQKNAAEQTEFSCCFKIPREVYQQLRMLSVKTTLSMQELYRRAATEYAEREMQQQATATTAR
jgi:hypothetical protein